MTYFHEWELFLCHSPKPHTCTSTHTLTLFLCLSSTLQHSNNTPRYIHCPKSFQYSILSWRNLGKHHNSCQIYRNAFEIIKIKFRTPALNILFKEQTHSGHFMFEPCFMTSIWIIDLLLMYFMTKSCGVRALQMNPPVCILEVHIHLLSSSQELCERKQNKT